MNPRTKFNQDAFVFYNELPGNVNPALSIEIVNHGVRAEPLNITSYTSGDTSGMPDKGLPDVTEGRTPRRISRKHIAAKSEKSSAEAVFPQNTSEDDFAWAYKVTHPSKFDSVPVSHKEEKQQTVNEKGGPSSDVVGLLKQLKHSDAPQSSTTQSSTGLRKESPVKKPDVNSRSTAKTHAHTNKETNNEVFTDVHHEPNLIANATSESKIYEQVRSIMGETKQDWKRVVKMASTPTNNATTEESLKPAQQEYDNKLVDNIIQQILTQESNNRTELEHVLTHKFSSELHQMQQVMSKKINDLREAMNSFMMR